MDPQGCKYGFQSHTGVKKLISSSQYAVTGHGVTILLGAEKFTRKPKTIGTMRKCDAKA